MFNLLNISVLARKGGSSTSGAAKYIYRPIPSKHLQHSQCDCEIELEQWMEASCHGYRGAGALLPFVAGRTDSSGPINEQENLLLRLRIKGPSTYVHENV
jgi:hypothetical protein